MDKFAAVSELISLCRRPARWCGRSARGWLSWLPPTRFARFAEPATDGTVSRGRERGEEMRGRQGEGGREGRGGGEKS
eukprot:766718-Hanusia_phi.AAC.6